VVSLIDVTGLVSDYGLALLFCLVGLESFGIPLPGETALIAAGILASSGHFSIAAVIAVASVAAILGDNAGYWVGRTGGRRALERAPVLRSYAPRVLPPAEAFFRRHGAKTVFVGRFVAVLRFTAAWLAGITHMPWWRFLAWNAAGGIAWAASVALVAYFFGRAAAEAVNRYGAVGAAVVAAAVVLALVAFHVWRRRALTPARDHSNAARDPSNG
jgi:membrane protein DedA with SNARE-associated domain